LEHYLLEFEEDLEYDTALTAAGYVADSECD